MKVLCLLLVVASVQAASFLPSIFGSSSSSTQSPNAYNRARDDMSRGHGQWVWVPNSALQNMMNQPSQYSGDYSSNQQYNNDIGNNRNSYSNGYNTNGYQNNRMQTTTYSSIFG